MKTDVCIIGAGPAGLMAAIHAAAENASVLLVERNATAGRKLLLTGGGRCNFTHAGGPEEIAKTFGKAGRFLRHSLYELPPQDVREFFHARGLASTAEPGGCVFPISNRAADVRDILVAEAESPGVRFLYESPVQDIAAHGSGFVVRSKGQEIAASHVIIATGGISWPQTGSTGDGYHFAARLGHTVVPPRPALVPLVTRETWPGELAGVSVPDVRMRATTSEHKCTSTGAMLFTQRGLGGPAAQDLSRFLTDEVSQGTSIPIEISLLPQLNEPQLDRKLQQALQAHPKKAVANVLSEFVPRQLAHVLCRLAKCDPDGEAGQLPADKRKRIVGTIEKLPLSVTGAEPIAKATVTQGGVSRSEIDPRTMESKIRPGLFFAGEVIDLDGPCGGYNLQMCWSTGAVAGRSATRPLPAANAQAQ